MLYAIDRLNHCPISAGVSDSSSFQTDLKNLLEEVRIAPICDPHGSARAEGLVLTRRLAPSVNVPVPLNTLVSDEKLER